LLSSYNSVTDSFVSHGSNVDMASLDARKDFDRVNHVKLFNIPVLINKAIKVYQGDL